MCIRRLSSYEELHYCVNTFNSTMVMIVQRDTYMIVLPEMLPWRNTLCLHFMLFKTAGTCSLKLCKWAYKSYLYSTAYSVVCACTVHTCFYYLKSIMDGIEICTLRRLCISRNSSKCISCVFLKLRKIWEIPRKFREFREIPEIPRKIPRENSGFFLIFRL